MYSLVLVSWFSTLFADVGFFCLRYNYLCIIYERLLTPLCISTMFLLSGLHAEGSVCNKLVFLSPGLSVHHFLFYFGVCSSLFS